MPSRNSKLKLFFSITFILITSRVVNPGEVYLVIGSDTAIWSGMNTARFNCHYNIALYTDPSANAYTVMDPGFRAGLTDSYGNPMKLTWWMMAGNIFRYADNTNVPIPNIMTMYLMKKYHGDNVTANQDELSLHYHTFHWYDYNGDGIYYWNQSQTFNECKEDFNFTLAQFLLDEGIFPVSFRSGWHYMDNGWQNYLDQRILPYSMHNDYPAINIDVTEPLDNNFDWSQAPAEFIPYHPSQYNYQLPGNGPGWNVRSAHFYKTQSRDLMDSVFAAAVDGPDQIFCIWGHLPETDFISNLIIMDSLANQKSAQYNVNFRYCTGIEAMQLWRNTADYESPRVDFTEYRAGEDIYFDIAVNEKIFQSQPFVAVKDKYERYTLLDCASTGTNKWRTITPVSANHIVKAGTAVCDTMGNQTLEFIEYLPDDKFIDNEDAGYAELWGNWSTSNNASWGVDSRIAAVNPGDSAAVKWINEIGESAHYNIFIQVPDVSNPLGNTGIIVNKNQTAMDTIIFSEPLPPIKWLYLSTIYADESDMIEVLMKGSNDRLSLSYMPADVIKITPLVRERDLSLIDDIINFEQIVVYDSVSYELMIGNGGLEDLIISDINSINDYIFCETPLPLVIPPMSSLNADLIFYSDETGPVLDTLIISSNDPIKPEVRLPVYAEVTKYFEIIDNEDLTKYDEMGAWNYSVAQAYGPTSRYAFLNSTPAPWARFKTEFRYGGYYDIMEIVPLTQNAANNALYEIQIGNDIIDSVYIDQNDESGDWVMIGNYFIPSDTYVHVRVIDNDISTGGDVLRADAVKFQLVEEATRIEDEERLVVDEFRLEQNYPNPFNPSTKITFDIPTSPQTPLPATAGKLGKEMGRGEVVVRLMVYDILGNTVATLIDKTLAAGRYEVEFNAAGLASGVYFYRIEAGNFGDVKKMILLR